MLGLMLAIFLGVSLMAAKLYNPRYLDAGFALSGLLVATVAEFYGRRAAVCGIVAALALLTLAGIDARAQIARAEADRSATERLTQALVGSGCLIVPYYFSGDPVYALRFGDDFAREMSPRYGDILRGLYGDRLFFNVWSHNVYDWHGRTLSLGEAVAAHRCLILRGVSRDSVMTSPDVARYITDQCRWGSETIYMAGGKCRDAFGSS
jgi:hypothetical protein